MEQTTITQKEIRIRNCSPEFWEALNALKTEYSESANSKTLERAVIDCMKLKKGRDDLLRSLDAAVSENREMQQKVQEFLFIENRRQKLLADLKELA